MKISRNGRRLIKQFEGFSPTAYKCSAGVWTIGWGNTYINGRPVRADDVVTLQEANKMFREYLARNVIPVIKSSVMYTKVPQHHVDAFASFIYNLGSGAFQNSTLLRKYNNLGFKVETIAEFHRWVYVGVNKLDGLVRRRKAEAHLFEYGELNFYE